MNNQDRQALFDEPACIHNHETKSGCAKGQPATQIFSGVVVAATLSSLLGFYTLMITHHVSRLSKYWDQFILSYGQWISGSVGSGALGSTGSYSGKESLALIVWLGSWAVFHYLWRKQEMSLQSWLPIFLGGLLLVTLGFIHPVIDPVILLLRDWLG